MATGGSRRMLTAEQIEKLIEIAKPDGFSFDNNYSILILPNNKCYKIIGTYTFECVPDYDSVYYPLFLQKCIEGVNKIEGYFAQQMKDCIIVIMEINDSIIDSTDYDFKDYNSIDQAKEQALIYMLDQLEGK